MSGFVDPKAVIPGSRLSTEVVYADFLEADLIEAESALVDYELGGRALNDPSEGLRVAVWKGWATEVGDVYLEAPGVPAEFIFSAPDITELSLAFDQNMRPFFAYVQGGQAKFRWYDTDLGANRITLLAADDKSPRCTMDDKRDMQVSQGANDIILAYVRYNALYYRQQRDRYEVEYQLAPLIPGRRFLKVGMNKVGRLQFEFEGEL